MNLTSLALLGVAVGLGQAPADVAFTRVRSSQLDINYTPDQRKNIRKVELLKSEDQGQTWSVADSVPADKDHLVFTAKADGVYWLTMMITFQDGKKDPPDPSRLTAERIQKLIVDTTPPIVRIATAKREAEEVLIDWTIEDQYPDESRTQVLYKTGGAGAIGDWLPAPVTAITKRSARFKVPVGPVAIRVVALDLAGNSGTTAQEIGTGTAVAYVAPIAPTSADPIPPPSLTPGGPNGPTAPMGPITAPATVPPPTLPVDPPVTPGNSAPTPTQPTTTPQPWSPASGPASHPSPLPVTTDPTTRTVPVGTEPPLPTTDPAADTSNTQLLNGFRFDLQYRLENGPSGVSRIDLYVTRDQGRTWTRWSQHDGRESPLRITLDSKLNTQPEGDYGLQLVAVSGAGLSDPPPSAGTPPDLRVHIDVTPPLIRVLEPMADPGRRDALLLRWQATDRNFGREPIAIDWSEQPTGPWKPVTGSESLVPVGMGQPSATAYRIANTGSYSWPIPTGMTAHKVYFRYTAWDLAGNRTAVITRDAFLVDLTKPRAKIQGIIPAGSPPR